MPTTREHSSCLEASRATALAAHSAAGLAAAAGLREAARLLRSCEALARAATAALQSSPTSAIPVRPGAAPADVPAASAAPAAGRHKKKKKRKAGNNSENMVIDGNAAGGVPAAVPAPAAVAIQMSPHAPAFAPGAAAVSARVLEKKPSRERSPRRAASPMQPSSSLPSPSSTISPALAAGVDGFSVGQAAVLTGLVSRPELAGCLVTLRSFDAASSRWAATLDTNGESIRVKENNLRPSIFKPGALAAGAYG